MNCNVGTFVRSEFKNRTPIELSTVPVAALLGVSPEAVSVLASIHVKTVFDLAVSRIFTASAEISRAAAGEVDGLGKYGIVPGDLVDDDALGASFAELSSKPPAVLRAVDAAVGGALAAALNVADIRELALWPPYQHARRILASAYGGCPDPEAQSEVPGDLIPGSRQYATERVQYDVLVLEAPPPPPPPPPPQTPAYAPERLRASDSPGMSSSLSWGGGDFVTLTPTDVRSAGDSGIPLESAGQLDLSKLALESTGFKRPATGAILTYTQSWYTEGLSLGQLLHTVALAPGESTRIAMIDWSRRTTGITREDIIEGETLTSDLIRNRSIGEIVSAVAMEAQNGFSRSAGWSVGGQIGHAGGGAGSADLDKAGAPVKLAAGHGESIGVGGAYGTAETTGFTTGQRFLSGNLAQNVLDKTHQESTLSRNRWATVIREISQAESEKITTRIITNYNHMHALSIEYFEIVQLYRVVVELSKATPCLFVPMKLLNFEQPGVVERFRSAIAAAGLTPRVRALAQVEPDRMVFYAPGRISAWDPAPVSRMLGERVGERESVSLVLPLNFYPSRITINAGTQPFVSLVVTYGDGHVDDIGLGPQQGIGATTIVLDKFAPTSPDSTPFWEVVQIRLKKSPFQLDFAGQVQIQFELFAMGRSGFPMPQESDHAGLNFPIDVHANEREPILFEFTRTVSGRELYRHLADHALHYSQAVWRSLNPSTIAQLLSTFTWEGRPLLSSIDPLPVAVSGNYLVFRRHQPPSDVAAALKWEAWLRSQDIDLGERRQTLVPLPSGGVFAEAVLGRFNSAEKLDITRFWNWQDSPIPITPPEIAAIQAGTRAQPENLSPGQLSPPVLNIQVPPDLPDPKGLTAILEALQKENLFRDMSGMSATVAFAQTALTRAFDSARDAARQASENMKTAAEIYKAAFGGTASSKTQAGAADSAGTADTQSRNISEAGAKINKGAELDARGNGASGSGTPDSGKKGSKEVEAFDNEIGGSTPSPPGTQPPTAPPPAPPLPPLANVPLDPGTGGRSINPAELQIGDIILSTTDQFASGLIRLGSGSVVSHSILYIGDGLVVEAIGSGVKQRTIQEALADARLAVAFRYQGLSFTQALKIRDFAGNQLDKPYDKYGVVRQALFRLDFLTNCMFKTGDELRQCRDWARRVNLGTGTNDQWFCSELVIAAYASAGVPLTLNPPAWNTPQDIVEIKMNGMLGYVGHLITP